MFIVNHTLANRMARQVEENRGKHAGRKKNGQHMWRLIYGISSCGFCMAFFLSILIYGTKCKVLNKKKLDQLQSEKNNNFWMRFL
jgi:hypothetical protein